eukprot:gene1044-1325_t
MQLFHTATFPYAIQIIAGATCIFDTIRKKYVRLTPEEWTRQHLIHHLTQDLSYPKGLIRVEKKIRNHYLADRPDLVVYDRNSVPLLIAECKAPHVVLNDHVYHQLARYNQAYKAPLLVISNGNLYGCWRINYQQFSADKLASTTAKAWHDCVSSYLTALALLN